jgi:Zn-finger nucleic acid-binding protein
MDALHIECLRCGDVRVLFPVERHRVDGGECPRCRYVGWAASAEVDEALRRRLRTRPLERRRLYAA